MDQHGQRPSKLLQTKDNIFYSPFCNLQVERVISNFYYRRAGWNIVERKLAFPDEPLPDPAFLRRDFETCVLEGKMLP